MNKVINLINCYIKGKHVLNLFNQNGGTLRCQCGTILQVIDTNKVYDTKSGGLLDRGDEVIEIKSVKRR